MTDHRHEDNPTRIAHDIETRLHHGDDTKSTLHDELHKLQKLDTHHGHLNAPQFKQDVHSVEHKLHKDGYLPDLHISLNHSSHIKLEHSKNNKTQGKAEHRAGAPDHKLDGPPIHHPPAPHRETAPGHQPPGEPLTGRTQLPNGDPNVGHNTPRIELPNSGHNKPRIADPNIGHNTPRIDDPNAGHNTSRADDPNAGHNKPRIEGPRSGQNRDPVGDPNFDRNLPQSVDPRSLDRGPVPSPERQASPYPNPDVDPNRNQRPRPLQNSLPGLDLDFGRPPLSFQVPETDRGFGQQPVPFRAPIIGRDPTFDSGAPYLDRNSGRGGMPFSPPQDLNSGGDRIPYPNPNRDHLRRSDSLRDQAGQDNGDGPAPFDRSDNQNKFEGQFKELRLDNRSANHPGADAMVYVRKDFDPSKPVHLVVYNHGFESTVSNALSRDKVKEMMSHAQANTVLVLPEWQSSPGSRSGNSGAFQQQDKFTNMVQEMMQKTPALHGAGLRNVDRIDIIAHSAGYSPTQAEINKNPAISNKVHSITLLDSLYSRHAFDQWLGDNINDLSSGRKQFYNFSNTTTSVNSREQAQMVGAMLRKNGLPTNNYVADYGSSSGQVARHGSEMAGRSIVFASTTVRHGDIPSTYIGPTLTALNPERYQTPQV